MRKIILFLFPLLLLFIAASCEKPDDDQATTEPHTTLRCKVNGEDWSPAGGGAHTIYPYNLEYYEDINSIGLLAFISLESVKQTIDIGSNFEKLDEKNSIKRIGGEFKNRLNSSDCVYYDLDTLVNNYIQITNIDTVNYTMEGTFEFSAINECSDTVYITEGYFDLPYTF